MRCALTVTWDETTGLAPHKLVFEDKDISGLTEENVAMYSAAFYGIVDATLDHLGWSLNVPQMTEGAPSIVEELYKRLQQGLEAREAAAATAAQQPAMTIKRSTVKFAGTRAKLLQPLHPVEHRASGLIAIGG